LNKLQGLKITNLKVLSGKNEILPDGSNLVGDVYISNLSVMILDLGNVTINLAVDGKALGTALLPNLVLKPGDNNVRMQSTVDQLSIISLVTTKYKNGVLPLEIKGNSSVVNGQHLPYFEAALMANTIKVDLDAGPALQSLGINVTQIAAS
jgi:hypothetical protein